MLSSSRLPPQQLHGAARGTAKASLGRRSRTGHRSAERSLSLCAPRSLLSALASAQSLSESLRPGEAETCTPRPGSTEERLADLVAGVSVAFVCVPQSLAYAALAGLSPHQGLHSNAVAPLGAAPFASSRYLQTGACAMSSLLTSAALLSCGLQPGSAAFCGGATLLALLVGCLRVALSLLNGGSLIRRLPPSILDGFVCGACWLVAATQLPVILGASPPPGMHYLAAAVWLLMRPQLWQPGSLLLAIATAGCLLGCKRIHPLLPGAVVATLIGCAASALGLPVGESVGAITAGLPALADPRNLPWHLLPQLAGAAAAITIAGVAEACAIGSRFALLDGERWDPNKELGSQGAACLASAAFGGFPVAGALSRTSLARAAGARTQLSHVFTAVAVLLFLPLGAPLLAVLPKAVLGGLVATAVFPVLRPSSGLSLTRAMLETVERAATREEVQTPVRRRQHIWRRISHLALGWTTLVCTLIAGKRLELGLEAGLALAALLAAAQAVAQ